MSSAGNPISTIAGGIGDILASGDFSRAASIDEQAARYEAESTKLQEFAANREIFSGLGAQQSVAGGGNLRTAGSVTDILRNTVSAGSLRKGQIAVQGAINEANFEQMAAGASAQATTSLASGIGGTVGGIASLFAG